MVSVEQVSSNWMPSGLDTPPPFQDVEGYVRAAMSMPSTMSLALIVTKSTRIPPKGR
jgi:hypothetical protein